MPELKQPASLESLAMDLVVKSVVGFCDQPRASGSLENVLQEISVIKKDFHDRITSEILPGFSNRLLKEYEWDKCCRPKHSEGSMKIALEMILDVDIVGLRCGGEILQYLDHRDVHRLRGLVELDLEYFLPDVAISLNNFHLNDLTTFIHPDCTDIDVTVIQNNCPKLQELKIIFSQITDEGLRTLSSCCELLVLDLWGCEDITDSGVIDLISVHEKLTELRVDGVDFLSRLEKQCPSMKRLTMTVEGFLTDAHLHSVVLNFPNLTCFGLINSPVVDLTILKSLSRLEEIDLDLVNVSGNSGPVDLWRSLKELLTLIGRNIKMLNFNCWDDAFLIKQDGLNFLFEFCPNIEYLKFDHQFEDLVIPPFRRLKVLIPRDPQCYPDEDDESRVISEIKFDKLLNLESLSLMDIPMDFDTVKSIILDHVNFPKLSELKMDPLKDKSHGETLEHIIRNNNLDIKIRYDCDSRAQVELNLLH